MNKQTKTGINIDKKAYKLAKDYLLNLNDDRITPKIIKGYLTPISPKQRPKTKQELYKRILISGQNANMKARVIGRSIKGIDNLASVLFDFDPISVQNHYHDNWENVLDDIIKRVKPHGQIRRTKRSIWPHFCKTILSGASFINQFKSANDFYKWINFFDQDNRARASLPMLVSHEINGYGFALACDFLKELGYINFPKPDVHLREIFTNLKLCLQPKNDYQLFKSIIRLANNAKVSPYTADKVFWIIGSGFFYNNLEIGNNGRIGSHRQKFIKYAQAKLYPTARKS